MDWKDFIKVIKKVKFDKNIKLEDAIKILEILKNNKALEV